MSTPAYKNFESDFAQYGELALVAPPTPNLDPNGVVEAAKNIHAKVVGLSNFGMNVILENKNTQEPIGRAEIEIDETDAVIGLKARKARIKSVETDPSYDHSALRVVLGKLAARHLFKDLEVIEGLPGLKNARIATETELPEGWELALLSGENSDIDHVYYQIVRTDQQD